MSTKEDVKQVSIKPNRDSSGRNHHHHSSNHPKKNNLQTAASIINENEIERVDMGLADVMEDEEPSTQKEMTEDDSMFNKNVKSILHLNDQSECS